MSMHLRKGSAALLLGACLMLGAALVRADDAAVAKQVKANEKKISAMALPAAVQKATREHSKGATILTIAREIKDWKTVYEVAMKVNGRTKDLIIATNGRILVSEVTVDLDAVPDAVKETIEKNLGKAKLVEVLSVTEGDAITHYEARVMEGKKESEIKVSADGKLLPPDPKEEE